MQIIIPTRVAMREESLAGGASLRVESTAPVLGVVALVARRATLTNFSGSWSMNDMMGMASGQVSKK